ncbi:MAG: DNA translocase FtsK [Anaerolineae bacterium]|nr:DNA translocase FtsK [Anaerolineae bacterium]
MRRKKKPNPPWRNYEQVGGIHIGGGYIFPPGGIGPGSKDRAWINKQGHIIERTLNHFNIPVFARWMGSGPTLARFSIEPFSIPKGDREVLEDIARQILALTDDLKLALAAKHLYLFPPAPDENILSLLLPHPYPASMRLLNALTSPVFSKADRCLRLILGQEAMGENVIVDLQKLPHLLIGGKAGAGKQTLLHALITALFFKTPPDSLRLCVIGTRYFELTLYNYLPHLLMPVIMDPAQGIAALRELARQMDARVKRLEQLGITDVETLHTRSEKQGGEASLPYIVVIIDELSTLMLEDQAETHRLLLRLFQDARRAGIHFVVATQAPLPKTLPGAVRSRLPASIALQVGSEQDSRFLLGCAGAECLLGRGDMLFQPRRKMDPLRIQGAFISSDEVARAVAAVKRQ